MSRGDTLRLSDWFCGAGGSTQGLASVPGVEPVHAANHWARAIESHAANFPDVDHHQGDIRDLDVSKLPYAEMFWASPECPAWSQANGKQRTYATCDQEIPGLERPRDEEAERSRALMEEVPLYLEAMAARGRPVLAGVVENVTDVRQWVHWDAWLRRIQLIGYRTRLIALNSMHAQSVRTPRAPQSRDRLYLAYWHESLGRDPDWDKWLRPRAYCPACGEDVDAVQEWKRPGVDMGRYGRQYVYRCPRWHSNWRSRRRPLEQPVLEPYFLPASAAIDWTVRGERIGDRARPLAEKTIRRIEAGILKYARPITLEAAGNTFERRPGVRTWPVDGALTTLTTTATKAVAIPPLLVPVEGRDGKSAFPVDRPMRTQSTRSETALAVLPPMLVPAGGTWNDTCTSLTEPMRTRTVRESEALLVPPFIAELRGGGSIARPVADPLATVTASGNHHGLVVAPGMVMRNNGSRGAGGEHCTSITDALRTLTTTGHQSLVTWDDWAALYQYDSGLLRALADALPAQTTVGGDALLHGSGLPAVEDCWFRMLEPDEIGAGMAFRRDYKVLGNRRERTRQFGNAVTPPVAEVIGSALVEAITGEAVPS